MAVDTGAFIRTVRERHKLTQSQLATLARTKQSSISRWETGDVSPSVKTLDHLIAVMDDRLVIEAEVAQTRVASAW
jgi:transcriptional regulator with XRE-family HTH domain